MSALDDAGPIIHKEGTMSLIPEGEDPVPILPILEWIGVTGVMMEVGSPGTVRRFEPSKWRGRLDVGCCGHRIVDTEHGLPRVLRKPLSGSEGWI